MAATRKCADCGKNISIKDKNNLGHILRYRNKFYHTSCFIALAESRVAKNNSYSASWQDALNNIDALIEDARKAITVKVKTDPLNDYLLINYDVGTLSPRFWSMVADIGNGIYKHKRCKPVNCDMLLDMWQHYQRDLNSTNTWNKSHGKNIEGESRIIYDLAILMGKYGEYTKMKSREAVRAAEAQKEVQQPKEKINYNGILSNKNTKESDIYSLLDDIF